MKRIIIALIVATAFCTLALAQKKITISAVKDSIGKAKITLTKTASATNEEDSDTTFIAEWEDTPDSASNTAASTTDDNDDFPFNFDGQHFGSAALLIPIVGIIMGCGLPIFIIFITFFFRYKNKKAKYRLVEQALASGQPIPEGVFSEQKIENDIQTRGIKNTFMGIGLLIFLWALTGNFGLGCIGLLIMFTGLGQLVISYTQKPSTIEKKAYSSKRSNQDLDEKANHEEKSDKPSTEE